MIRFILLYIFVFTGCSFAFGQSNDTIPYGNVLDENLLISVYNHDYSKVVQFVRKGAKVNAVDDSGFTPLIYAIANKDVPIVEFLLSNGADANLAPTYTLNPISVPHMRQNKYQR